jgi:hypothetical protein
MSVSRGGMLPDGMQGRAVFMTSGGWRLALYRCLNDVDRLVLIVRFDRWYALYCLLGLPVLQTV